MMDAHEFTKFISGSDKDGEGHTFGVSAIETAKRLRELADRIECGQTLPQQVRIVSHAKHDDWTYTFLRIVFSDRVPKEPDGTVKKLYGAGQYPVATAKAQ